MEKVLKVLKHVQEADWIKTKHFAKDMGYSDTHIRNMINGARPTTSKFGMNLKYGLKEKIEELQALVDILEEK